MLSQRNHFNVEKYDGSWSLIERFWRRASGYSRLIGTSSPPLPRRRIEDKTAKFDCDSKALPRAKAQKNKPSTARPVVVVERTRDIRLPELKSTNARANINEEFVEVFYWTQSRYNYPGQLERYKKNLCYCCADCPACRQEMDRTDRHRQLEQNSNITRRRNGISKFNRGYNNGTYLRTSYT